jgi:hypothetical protein
MVPTELGPDRWVYRCDQCEKYEFPERPVKEYALLMLTPPFDDCPTTDKTPGPNLKQILAKQGGLKTGPEHVHFEDDFIKVWVRSFNPKNGLVELIVEKKQSQVGSYYITLSFESGDSALLSYNGESPSNPRAWTPNSSHKNDTLIKLEATKHRQ